VQATLKKHEVEGRRGDETFSTLTLQTVAPDEMKPGTGLLGMVPMAKKCVKYHYDAEVHGIRSHFHGQSQVRVV